MSIPKPDGRLSVGVMPNEILASPSSQPLIQQDQQDEETSDCPLLTPSPPPNQTPISMDGVPTYKSHGEPPTPLDQTLGNINTEDGLAFLNIVNSTCKAMHDEPSSRDPMVETSSNSGSSSDTNEPVCTQLLTQLNTAYTHLAPDAQALFYNQDNGGIPPLTGIQLMVPKPPKNYGFMSWNWPIIRKTCFWTLMSLFAGSIALAIGVIATMPKNCDPPLDWWQGSLFYEIFPGSFDDSAPYDGVGDLRGVSHRLDYLENLGVKGVRLNSIFKSKKYPQQYTEIDSLTDLDATLGTHEDFAEMLSAIHSRRMNLILDLPLYPFVKSLSDDSDKRNSTEYQRRQRRDVEATVPPRHETVEALTGGQPRVDLLPQSRETAPLHENEATQAIRYWHDMGVDGFYLKGLEHYVNEPGFVAALRTWKTILGPGKVLMCSERALHAASGVARNAILSRLDLVDVVLDISNGTDTTKNIKAQVSRILKGPLFEKAGYPWVHWSTGSIDTARIASTLKTANATVAIAMMGMMLPGTPSIFYGDEIGVLNSESLNHHELAHMHQLVPMRWDGQSNEEKSFTTPTATPWMSESAKPAATNLTGLVSKMATLRSETTPIYVKAVIKNNEPVANADVRYTQDDIIVIERWYPRRNTYVFVANLGMRTQTKDLSSLYYSGHVVVGPEYRLDRNIYFKELTIPPGEAFIIKLDKCDSGTVPNCLMKSQ